MVIVVRNLDEAKAEAHRFGAVVTAGPKASDAAFGHPMQRARTFADTTSGPMAPSIAAVTSLVDFGAAHADSLLIHCHRGESRSPAIAIGVAVKLGHTVDEACDLVRTWAPPGRAIKPNPLIVQHLERILDRPGLAATVARHWPSVAGHLGAATTRAW